MIYILRLFFSILFFLSASLILTPMVFADGVQFSTTQLGSTATFTSQLPADPCGTHKLGETKTRTVVGFIIDAHPIDEDGVVRVEFGKPVRADLSNAQISNITIAEKQITDFQEDQSIYSAQNWKDFVPFQRTYKLSSPIEFTPQDTASITVTNVAIKEKGRINPWFGLQESTGVYCLSSKYTILGLGENVAIPTPTLQAQQQEIKPIEPPDKSVKGISTSTKVQPEPLQNKPINISEMNNNSPIKNFLNFLKKLFSREK